MALALTSIAAAAALVAGGCWTDLDLNLGGPEGHQDIPSMTDALSIRRPELRGRLDVTAAGTVFTFGLPAHVDACRSGPMPDACADGDGDGLIDRFEDAALDALRPFVLLSPDDPLFQDRSAVGSLGRVTLGPDGTLHAIIILAYSRDYGSCSFTQHQGDPERVAVELAPLPPDGWLLTGFFTAAHEGTSRDSSRLTRAADFPEVVPDAQGVRWRVYASGGKHATYATRAICESHSSLPCLSEHCPGEGAIELLFPIVNAGEPDDRPDPLQKLAAEPLMKASNGFGFLVFSGESAWTDEPFCGGQGGSPCAGSLREKLVDDPFSGPTPP